MKLETLKNISILSFPVLCFLGLYLGIKSIDLDVYQTIKEEKVIDNIGYIDCFNDDGTGPYYECGKMEVRCYKDRQNRERVECPTFENWSKTN